MDARLLKAVRYTIRLGRNGAGTCNISVLSRVVAPLLALCSCEWFFSAVVCFADVCVCV